MTRRRKPNVTEQVAHAELCQRANAREAAKAEANAAPEPPEGSGLVATYGGWWPEGWIGETPDSVTRALGMLLRAVYTHPSYDDVEREYYRARVRDAKESYDQTRRNAAAHIERANAEYAERLAARSGPGQP